MNRVKMICEYCGTQFREDKNEIRIMAYQPGIHTLQACAVVPEYEAFMYPKEASEYGAKICGWNRAVYGGANRL